MMRLEQKVGKLAEVRYVPPLTMDELTRFMAAVRALVDRSTTPLVFCCDWRAVDAFEPTMADTVVWIMRRDNPRIAANGVLVAAHKHDFHAQVQKILSEARNAQRRVFDNERQLRAWIDPQLDDRERARCEAFLGEARG